MGGFRRISFAVCAAVGVVAAASIVSADGTEMLGTPSIPIATGSGVAIGGTGLDDGQPQDIAIDVPAGASIVQVLVYWEGHNSTASGDDTIVVDGNDVAGALIGGPTLFFGSGSGAHWSSTYRADITALGLVAAGANTVSVSGLDFDQNNNGAGILAIYDDGSDAEIAIVDGNDLAYTGFAEPLKSTVPQTFTFTPEGADRVGHLNMFFSSVAGPDVAGLRPSTIQVTVDGVTTEYVNVLASSDGNEWDSIEIAVEIPGGVDAVTVQAFSDDRAATGLQPASFAWNAAGLSIPVTPPPPPSGGEGCTPGYWKQPHHLDSWVGYTPDQNYEAVFGIDASFSASTLLEVLEQGGGGEKALGRHAVAALLNSASSVDYLYSTADVIAAVQQAYASGDFNGVKDLLAGENEMGCPLN